MWLAVSRFMGMGLVSGFSLASHLVWPVLGLTQVYTSFLVMCTLLSQGSWEDLLPPIGPSQILLVSLQGSTVFLIRASCCETTHESNYRLSSCLAKVGSFSQWSLNNCDL